MSVIGGYPGAVRWKGRWSFDPVTGDVLEHTWNGPKRPIFALYAGFRRAGIRATVEHKGPLYTLTADIGALQNQDETPQDEWEIDHEMVRVSIFNLKEVAEEAEAAAADGVVFSIADYKLQIETAVRKGDPNKFNAQGYPEADKVYTELARGNEAMELDRIVLRRVRHFSNSYAKREVLTVKPTVYKTAALLREFAPIPDVIQKQLPGDPLAADTPKYTTWAWKVRRNKSTPVPRLNKIKEEKEWVFAAWADLSNTIIST